jgi:hypothetical protein
MRPRPVLFSTTPPSPAPPVAADVRGANIDTPPPTPSRRRRARPENPTSSSLGGLFDVDVIVTGPSVPRGSTTSRPTTAASSSGSSGRMLRDAWTQIRRLETPSPPRQPAAATNRQQLEEAHAAAVARGWPEDPAARRDLYVAMVPVLGSMIASAAAASSTSYPPRAEEHHSSDNRGRKEHDSATVTSAILEPPAVFDRLDLEFCKSVRIVLPPSADRHPSHRAFADWLRGKKHPRRQRGSSACGGSGPQLENSQRRTTDQGVHMMYSSPPKQGPSPRRQASSPPPAADDGPSRGNSPTASAFDVAYLRTRARDPHHTPQTPPDHHAAPF